MYFVLYSFVGFILETLYTLVTRGILISKKCFLINLLCPVYGLGAIAIVSCTRPIKQYKILTFVMGGLAATVVEYILHFIYQEILGVSIWNYSNLPYVYRILEYSVHGTCIFHSPVCGKKNDNHAQNAVRGSAFVCGHGCHDQHAAI